MITKYYKIKGENHGFMRTGVTKLGHVNNSVQTVHTFKDAPDNRYVRIAYNKDWSEIKIDAVESKLNSLCTYEAAEDQEELFQLCLGREGTRNYLMYFDRDTYVR